MMPQETLQAILQSLINERREAAVQAALTASGDDRANISTTSAALVQALALEEAVRDLYEHHQAKQEYINKLVDRCAGLEKERDGVLNLLRKKSAELEARLDPDLEQEAEALEAQENAAAQEATKEWMPGKVEKYELAQLWKTAFRDGWNACRKYHGMK